MSNGTATNQTMDELDKYLKMSIDGQYKVPNPLILRHLCQEKFPYLVKSAVRLYSIPTTSACVEGQFGASNLLVSKRWSSLNPDTVENVLFVRFIQKALKNNLDPFSV